MTLFVVGMHRSGTSMVTGLLEQMGFSIGRPEKLLKPKKDNPLGFWERQDIVDLNDQLLKSNEASWYKISEFSGLKIISNNLISDRDKILQELMSLESVVLKDPRFCLTLPFWMDAVPKPKFIFVYRHPLEVAMSLYKRNKFPLRFGLALWEKYNRLALKSLEGKEVIYLSHNEILLNPIETIHTFQKEIRTLTKVEIKEISNKQLNTFVDAKLYQSKTAERIEDFITEDQWDLYENIIGCQINTPEISEKCDRELFYNEIMASQSLQLERLKKKREEKRKKKSLFQRLLGKPANTDNQTL